ncbi:Retrotransposon-derived protein PEG10, partial [Zancudomyces culisetae]
MDSIEERLNKLTLEIQILKNENQQLKDLSTRDSTPHTHVATSRISLPERYDGDRRQYRGFVNQCKLLFLTHHDQYETGSAKVGLVMSLLSGNALLWASPFIEKNSPVLYNFEMFLKEFSRVFDDPQRTQTANDAVRALRQGPQSVAIYASEFRRLIMDLDWNESAYVSQFAEGLNDNILDALALFKTPQDLEDYINAAINIDTRLTRRKEDKVRKKRGFPLQLQPNTNQFEPMQVDSLQKVVSNQERERRMKKGLEGELSLDHTKDKITPPIKISKDSIHHNLSSLAYPQHEHRFYFTVIIHLSSTKLIKVLAMIDSGASGIFIDSDFVKNKGIPIIKKPNSVPVEFVDGTQMTGGPITHESKQLLLQANRTHWEYIKFEILPSTHADIILGLPWLEKHQPTILWKQRMIKFENTYCQKNCQKKTVSVTTRVKSPPRFGLSAPTFGVQVNLPSVLPPATLEQSTQDCFKVNQQPYNQILNQGFNIRKQNHDYKINQDLDHNQIKYQDITNEADTDQDQNQDNDNDQNQDNDQDQNQNQDNDQEQDQENNIDQDQKNIIDQDQEVNQDQDQKNNIDQDTKVYHDYYNANHKNQEKEYDYERDHENKYGFNFEENSIAESIDIANINDDLESVISEMDSVHSYKNVMESQFESASKPIMPSVLHSPPPPSPPLPVEPIPKETYKKFADKKRSDSSEFRPGVKVWLSQVNLPCQRTSAKLDYKYTGPFTITEMVNPVAARLELPPSMK